MPGDKHNRPIPVIDMGQLGLGHESDPSSQEWTRVAKEINDAFKDIGFVYLAQHGLPEEQIDKVVNAGATFFDLPEEHKLKFPRDQEKQQGWVAPNREKFDDKYSYELREAYDVKRTDGMFPDDLVPDFRPATIQFLESCNKLTNRILVALALGLGLDRNFFLDCHQEVCSDNNASALRLLHYPPVPANISADTIRCGTHTDYGTITLLFQDDIGGLQVQDRSGNWVGADPLPGTILVNVGDILQFWTSNQLVATAHRVLIPEEELRQRKCRRSTVFFIHPDDPTIIRPVVGSSKGPLLTAREHVLKRFSETYQY